MEWLGDHLWAAWLLLAVGLGVAEMVSLDQILLMVAVGALVGGLVALAGAPFILQVLLAAGASGAMLMLVRPSLVARLHDGPTLVSGHDRLVGQQGSGEGRWRDLVRLSLRRGPHHPTGSDRRGVRDPRRHGVRPSGGRADALTRPRRRSLRCRSSTPY